MQTALSRLGSTARKFIREWGDLGDRWGIDRADAEVLALLYLAGEPVEVGTLVEALDLDPFEAKTATERLRAMGLVHAAPPGEAGAERVECLRSAWQLMLKVAEERRRRELDPALQVLRECVLRAESEDDEPLRRRFEEMQEVVRLAAGLHTHLSTLTPAEARRLVRLGPKLRKILGAI